MGRGYSSPVVADGRVYIHARQEGLEVLWCLDLATGEVLWRQDWSDDFVPPMVYQRHGKGPHATPTVADGRIYTLSGGGVLSAWATNSGTLLWQRSSEVDFDSRSPLWGASSSPLIDGDRVIAHLGGHGGGALLAFDGASGRELWRSGGDGPSYASPVAAEIDGVRQLVSVTEGAVVGLDLESGRSLWRHPFAQTFFSQNVITPVVHDGLVIVSGEGRGIFALRPVRQGNAWKVDKPWHERRHSLDNELPGDQRRALLRAVGPRPRPPDLYRPGQRRRPLARSGPNRGVCLARVDTRPHGDVEG